MKIGVSQVARFERVRFLIHSIYQCTQIASFIFAWFLSAIINEHIFWPLLTTKSFLATFIETIS